MKPIYLDYNATTPLDPAVIEAMQPFLREHFGNPSSAHAYGRSAHEAVERARRQVADLLGPSCWRRSRRSRLPPVRPVTRAR